MIPFCSSSQKAEREAQAYFFLTVPNMVTFLFSSSLPRAYDVKKLSHVMLWPLSPPAMCSTTLMPGFSSGVSPGNLPVYTCKNKNRLGSARLVTARFTFPPQFGTALKCRRDYSRVVIVAPPLLPWHHRKRATNKHTTKEHIDGIVFFTLGMWMFLTAMERPMRMLVIYPQQQRLWCSATGCRGGGRDVCAGVLHY